MISVPSVRILDVTVVVAGNTGNKQFSSMLNLNKICIKAPASNSTYDYEITDIDGYGLDGNTNNTGNTTAATNTEVINKCTITFSNAANGTYLIRFYGSLVV